MLSMESSVSNTDSSSIYFNTTVSASPSPNSLHTLHQSELISYYERVVIVTVNRVGLSTVLGLTGVVSNVLNIYVFLKQGLHIVMNISFFVLAISGLLRTINFLWMTVCNNPEIDSLDVPFLFQDVQFLTSAWISGSLARISIFITTFMTIQRCISILKPMEIKTIITPLRSVIILFCIFLVNSTIAIPICLSWYLDHKFYPSKNRTLLGLVVRDNSAEAQSVVYILHAALFVISLVGLIFFTVVLILKMEQLSQWRQDALSKNQNQAISKRDKKMSKIVSLLAIFTIVLSTPTVTVSIASTFVSAFSVSGNQVNLYFAVWSFAYAFGAIEANVSVFIYYNMSSKYRDTVQHIGSFCCTDCKALSAKPRPVTDSRNLDRTVSQVTK
ncbi:melanopsin [Biomphalaria glabrata]|nr:melanopsin-like [Biomphalaria glabrata]